MSTEYVTLTGKCKWAKLVKPDDYEGITFWGLQLWPDGESLDKIFKLQKEGIKNRLKKDDDGYNIAFKRYTEKTYKNGETKRFDPPSVYEADGVTPLKNLIGNGSTVTVKLEVYEYKTPTGKTSKACRLDSVRADNLVVFEGKGSGFGGPAAKKEDEVEAIF